MTSFGKIALNTHHLAHPCSKDPSPYKDWQKKGVFTFAALTILTGGLAGLTILATALIKYLRIKQIEHLNGPTKKADDAANVIRSKGKPTQLSNPKQTFQGTNLTSNESSVPSDASLPNKDQIVASSQPSPEDLEKAHRLLIEGGHLLGIDNVKAEKLILQASDAGNDAAFLLLGRFYLGEKSYSKAIKLLEKPAKEGRSGCRALLALALEIGNSDLTGALFWLKEAYKLEPTAENKASIERVEGNIKVLNEYNAIEKKLLEAKEKKRQEAEAKQ